MAKVKERNSLKVWSYCMYMLLS